MNDQPKPTGEQENIALHTAAAKLAGADGIVIKPTGQRLAVASEWTAKDGCLYHGERRWPMEYHQSAVEIAERINAALAAEKAREEFDWGHVKREYLRLHTENGKLQEQLAAEQEKVYDGGQREECFKALTTITKLEHQLAAAQLAAAQLAIANHNRDNNNANGTCYKIKADTTALDAAIADAVYRAVARTNESAVAAQQPLVDALKRIANGEVRDCDAGSLAKDALAKKAKEGK